MKRHPKNPILIRLDIPEIRLHIYDLNSVCNPGGIKFNRQSLLMQRLQNKGEETYSIVATSDDGMHFHVENKIVNFEGIEKVKKQFTIVRIPV